MRVRITQPAAIHTAHGRRTLMPGLVVDLDDTDAQRLLALRNAVALDAMKPARKRKPVETTDAPA